jgi:hypothetical protein
MESEDIFEDPDKVTPTFDPQKEWLLVDVLGHSFVIIKCCDLMPSAAGTL